MAKILISGGTGLIGKQLTQKLQEKNYGVAILSRTPKGENQFKWDIKEQFIDKKAFKNVTHIVHLAGAGIADKRWTEERKKTLINSRVQTTNLLFQKVQEYQIPLRGFISSSGVGYYGAVTTDTIFTEQHDVGNDFVAKICEKWENVANQFKKLNTNVTILRTAVVLSKQGGALDKMDTPFFLAALGSGKQYFPWIHIDDLINLYIKAIEDTHFTGIYNAVAPQHQTHKSFTKTLGKIRNKPVLPFNIPAFILKLAFGNMSKILLKGSKVSAKKIENTGFLFQFTSLQNALENLYKTC